MSSKCGGCGQSQSTCSALQSRGKRGNRCCTDCTHEDVKLREPDARDKQIAELSQENNALLLAQHEWEKDKMELEELRGELDVADGRIESQQNTIRELSAAFDRMTARELRFIEWAKNREPWIGAIMIAYAEGGDLFKAVDEFIDFEKRNPPPKP